MSRLSLVLAFVFTASGLNPQSPRVASPRNICDVLKSPTSYNHRLITVRAAINVTEEEMWLSGSSCIDTVTARGFVWPRSIWVVILDRLSTRSTKTIRQVMDNTRLLWDDPIRTKKLYVTVAGVLETHDNLNLEMYNGRSGKLRGAGFGHLAASPRSDSAA